MEVLVTIIASSLVHVVLAAAPDLSGLENDFSPETFVNFNVSQKHKEFDLKEIETFAKSRRWDLVWYRYFAEKHVWTYELNFRACYFLMVTYLSAIPDIKRYFNLRFLYVKNLDYEVGYLVYSIVRKYQMLIEVYNVMYNKFYTLMDNWAAPTSYVFYMYRNALELAMDISHLCNMLHEVEAKYSRNKLGPWDDYPMDDEEKKKSRNQTDKAKEAYDDYQKRREQEYKRRQKERKKLRKGMNYDTKITTPVRRPKKSFWPLHYGWSIEFW